MDGSGLSGVSHNSVLESIMSTSGQGATYAERSLNGRKTAAKVAEDGKTQSAVGMLKMHVRDSKTDIEKRTEEILAEKQEQQKAEDAAREAKRGDTVTISPEGAQAAGISVPGSSPAQTSQPPAASAVSTGGDTVTISNAGIQAAGQAVAATPEPAAATAQSTPQEPVDVTV